MRELAILLSPSFWSIKNEALRLRGSFYKKAVVYLISGIVFIVILTNLLNTGMTKLKGLSPELFNVILIKTYSLVFLLIFFVQIINGFVISLNTFYNSKDLETLLISPVKRDSLFMARFIESHIKSSWMILVFGIPVIVSIGLIKSSPLYFYIGSSILLIFFLTIPLSIGTILAIFMARYVHARRLKNVLITGVVVSAILFITLLRLMRPEQFVNPELFANLTIFLAQLKTPSFILFPQRWLAESFTYLSGGRLSLELLVYTVAMVLNSWLLLLLCFTIFTKYHYEGWERFQEGEVRVNGRSLRGLYNFIDRAFSWLGTEVVSLIRKEVLSYLREPANVQELFILLSLIIVYGFSISVLPINWIGYYERLRYTVSIFNTGLILIILASISARSVYPLLSEGTTTWLIKISPLRISKYILTRFFLFILPILLTGVGLILFSWFFIKIEKRYLLLQMTTISFGAITLLGLTFLMGLSERELKKTITHRAKPQASALYMLISLAIAGVNLLFVALPAMPVLKGNATHISPDTLVIALLSAVVLNIFFTVVFLRHSIRTLESLEP